MEEQGSCTAANQRTYQCEECEEYLLIQETPAMESAETQQAPLQPGEQGLKQQATKKSISNAGSTDSGHIGEVTPSESNAPGPSESPPQQEDCEEEWCILELGLDRPKGLYGYRYVNYDDQEAEGNIHITDQDL